MKTRHIAAAVSAFTAFTAGCSQQTIQSASSDIQRNAEVVQREANRAERKVRPQVRKAGLGSRVTAALLANEKLPSTIRVDADDNGVKLRGSVRTQAEKELAGRIARDTLSDDKTVENDLVVKGKGD
jgi:osmotically-inducible protein OsmY